MIARILATLCCARRSMQGGVRVWPPRHHLLGHLRQPEDKLGPTAAEPTALCARVPQRLQQGGPAAGGGAADVCPGCAGAGLKGNSW